MALGFACWTTVVSGQTSFEQLNAAPDEQSLINLHQQLDIPRSDINVDGWVGFDLLLVLTGNYRQTNVGYGGGDLNLDGLVGLEDFAILFANFGHDTYLPEPASTAPLANLGLSRNAENILVVSTSSPVEIGGFELLSPGGSLSAVEGVRLRDSVRTMILDIANDSNQVAWGAIPGVSAELNGDLSTTIRSSSDDVSIRWFEPGSYDVHTLPFGGGDALTGAPFRQPEAGDGGTSPRPVAVPSDTVLDFSQLDERFKSATTVGIRRTERAAVKQLSREMPRIAKRTEDLGLYNNPLRNSYFYHQPLQKLGNIATNQSNVFAVWLTVGFFELEPNYPRIEGEIDYSQPYFVDETHPDGFQIGFEVGTSDAQRHRIFAIVDRSIPAAFEVGQNHNTENLIRLRRILE